MLVILPDLKIPHYLEVKYQFALKFHPFKFLPLPIGELALDFRPPFPRWFVCGSHLSVLQNEYLKPAKWVVSTKA